MQVTVYDNALGDYKQIDVSIPRLCYGISNFMLHNAQSPADIVRQIAKDMARAVEMELEGRLLQLLNFPTAPQPTFYSTPGFFAKANPQGDSPIPGLVDKFPGLQQPAGGCPDSKCVGFFNPSRELLLKDLVIHLNDIHRWTREQIADWLEESDYDITLKETA